MLLFATPFSFASVGGSGVWGRVLRACVLRASVLHVITLLEILCGVFCAEQGERYGSPVLRVVHPISSYSMRMRHLPLDL